MDISAFNPLNELAVTHHSSQVGRGVDCVNYNKCKQSRQADKDSGQSGQAALQRPLHSLFHDITLSIFHPLSTKCAVFNIQPAVYPATQTIYSISKLDNEIFNSESFDSLTDYLPNTKLEERDEERTLNIIATNTAGECWAELVSDYRKILTLNSDNNLKAVAALSGHMFLAGR